MIATPRTLQMQTSQLSSVASIIPFPKQPEDKCAYSGLSVDLGALKHNFLSLQKVLGRSVCSAVVKANAYGLGISRCSKALYDAGCRHFMVAYLDEALELKNALHKKDATIYILNGFMKGQEDEFLHHGFIPVLTDIEKIERWSRLSKQDPLPAVLHVDTGLNRTGLRYDQVHHPILNESLTKLNIQVVMSHLACSEDKTNPFNNIQRARFMEFINKLNLPYKPKCSLASSGAIPLGVDYYYDMARPGAALYGCTSPETTAALNLKSILRLWARIYQIQTVPAHETVGYGRSYTTKTDRKIAAITMGYADGFAWKAGATDHQPFVMIGGCKAPIVGRISMDLMTIDVTDVPSDYVYEGAFVDLVNEHVTISDLAKWFSTIPYEVILKFGERVKKSYVE